MSAAGVTGSTTPFQGAGAGSSPSAALHSLQVRPVPFAAAKALVERYHYLHSLPGGTKLALGVFLDSRLLGAVTFGAGPVNAHCLVKGATADDCLTLTRLWLSDELLANAESRVIGVALRAIRKHTNVKFLLSYADPAQGHVGTIYQATGWLYTGLSEAMPLYDLGDGVPRHSRSVSHAFGSHSTRHFAANGVKVKLVSQAAKYRYIYFLNRSLRSKLNVPVLPYPKKGQPNGSR